MLQEAHIVFLVNGAQHKPSDTCTLCAHFYKNKIFTMTLTLVVSLFVIVSFHGKCAIILYYT